MIIALRLKHNSLDLIRLLKLLKYHGKNNYLKQGFESCWKRTIVEGRTI
jgi:hypothetical protein